MQRIRGDYQFEKEGDIINIVQKESKITNISLRDRWLLKGMEIDEGVVDGEQGEKKSRICGSCNYFQVLQQVIVFEVGQRSVVLGKIIYLFNKLLLCVYYGVGFF